MKDRVSKIIELLGITQKAFGAAIGASSGNVNDWLKGRSLPSATMIIRIYEKFGFDPLWILTGEGDPKRKHASDSNTTRVSHFGDAAPGAFQQHIDISGKVKKGIKQKIQTGLPENPDTKTISQGSLSLLEKIESLPEDRRKTIEEMVDLYLSSSESKSSKK